MNERKTKKISVKIPFNQTLLVKKDTNGFVNKDLEYDIRGNSKIPFSLSTVDPFTIVFEYECIT